ncbi:MAG: GH36 C-terminal domain-containing protein, partial [Acetatifactor sp.]|nr:GH36 C-terminal domain-containing protein [Acetatifactor sp.]
FGYELDLTKLTDEEKAMIPGQLDNYKKYGWVFRTGDYYRLASYSQNHEYDAIMSVSKDKRTAVVDYIHVMSREKKRTVMLYPQGLDGEKQYRLVGTGEVHSGAAWMSGGMLMPKMCGDFLGKLIVLEAVEE